ncbi:MAG: heparinase II/III family protein [Selenomonas sp.]|nr:heparinase II/III family protein [Selenomonas sp.]
MKTSKFVADNGLELEYILQKSSSPSNALIVAFPGPGGGMRGGEWGYLVSIKKVADVNTLFLKTDPEYSKSRLTLRGGKPLIDEAIVSLVNRTAVKLNTKQIIAIGTSMGGYSALYFGLKYDWDIISGSPDYTFSSRPDKDIAYALGKSGDIERNVMNGLLASMVKLAGERQYSKRLFVSWGEGERIWQKDSEGPQMIKDMEKYSIPHTYSLYPFSDHLTCAELFPQTLERYLRYYLGLSDKPLETTIDILPPKVKMYKAIADVYQQLADVIPSCRHTRPNLDIKNNLIFGYNNNEVALRNYVYVKEGWLWSVGDAYKWAGGDVAASPVKIKNYWDQVNIANDRSMLSFYFQSTLLLWYKRQPDDSVLKWLLINFVEYVRSLPKISKDSFNYVHQKPFDHMIRLMYFIELHKLAIGHVDESVEKALGNEIIRSLEYIAEQGANPIPIRWQYRMVLGLLVFAVYYKNSEAYEAFCSAAMDIFNALNEYHFDRNGCCISAQMDSQDFLVGELKMVMDFITDNEMGKSKSYQKARRVYKKVVELSTHISQPNNRLPALGHTGVNQWCRAKSLVGHNAGNLILRESNLCFLEDGKSISYLTINGGSNVNSTNRHCDLMSFTWNYDGTQVFYDAGGVGRNDPFEEYVSSSIAHNGFICDELNYVTPDYSDWTAIDEDIEEREDCVIIPVSHTLIEGVVLKRTFFWIKPNILILMDSGMSDKDRAFIQNFLLGDFILAEKEITTTSLQISKDISGRIIQHFEREGTTLEEYRGKNGTDGHKNFRGTYIENWRTPRRGLNLAYSKKGKEARFVTSIELHSKKLAADEQSLQSVNFDADGNLIVVLGDGKIIYEKMPEKQ